MARQYRIAKYLPGAVQVRFEDAQRNLTTALHPLLSEFYPLVGPCKILQQGVRLCSTILPLRLFPLLPLTPHPSPRSM